MDVRSQAIAGVTVGLSRSRRAAPLSVQETFSVQEPRGKLATPLS